MKSGLVRGKPNNKAIDSFAVGYEEPQMRIDGVTSNLTAPSRVPSIVSAAANQIEYSPQMAVKVLSEMHRIAGRLLGD